MDAIDLLLTRRSVLAQNLVEPGPDDTALRTLLRAATRVPDHGKLTPWRIQILRADGQAALGDFLARLFGEQNPQASQRQIDFERRRPQRAPLLLVVTAKLKPGHKIPEFEQLMSGAAVCQTLLIAARALGFSGQWLTEWPAYQPELVEHLGHDPGVDRILGFIYLGTAASAPDERPRPALDDIVSEWAGPAP